MGEQLPTALAILGNGEGLCSLQTSGRLLLLTIATGCSKCFQFVHKICDLALCYLMFKTEELYIPFSKSMTSWRILAHYTLDLSTYLLAQIARYLKYLAPDLWLWEILKNIPGNQIKSNPFCRSHWGIFSASFSCIILKQSLFSTPCGNLILMWMCSFF